MKRAPGTQIKCKQTKAIFAWFEKLKGMIQGKHAALVSEAAHKVDLFLGHVISSTSMACVKLNREELAALEARMDKVKYAVSKVFTVTSPLEVRFATDSTRANPRPDTLHATSASPAAQVVKRGGREMKQLMAYLDAHPLCLTLEYFEKLQAAAKATPAAGAAKRAPARRQPAPAAKRHKTAAAARPATSTIFCSNPWRTESGIQC